MLNKIYKHTFCKNFFQNPHIQTIYPTLFAKPIPPAIETEIFQLNDGDFIECYWHHKPKNEQTKPIVILFHGLAGSFHSPYIQQIMHALHKEGFSSVLMHFRGCSGKPNRLPRSYHSGDTADAKAWISKLHKNYPDSKLYAIGYSLGANMLLKLLGEWKDQTPLQAAVSISAPLKLDICADKMNKGFSKFYQRHLLKYLKKDLHQKYIDHDMNFYIALKEKEIKNIKSFRAFDDAYTAPIHGFKDAKDYYQQCSAINYLKDIKIPTSIIHALDDPFMTKEILPQKEQCSDNVKLSLFKHGGHVGFIGGNFFKPQFLLQDKILSFIKNF